jgi:hypothetical protein
MDIAWRLRFLIMVTDTVVCLQEAKRADKHYLYYVYSTYAVKVIFTLQVKWSTAGKKRPLNL